MSFVLPVTDTIAMRLLEPHHAKELWSLVQEHRKYIRQWLTWPEAVHSEQDVRDQSLDLLKAYADRKDAVLSIVEDGKIVGGTGWNLWQQGLRFECCQEGSADIGYWLLPHAVGRGIVTKCVIKLLDHLFDERELFRVTIRAEPENTKSCAVPERLGFTYEGTLRHVFRLDGRWINHRLYSMLAEEWPGKKSKLQTHESNEHR